MGRRQTVSLTVTLEIEVPYRWSDACTIGQLRVQAIEEARSKLRQLLEGQEEIRASAPVVRAVTLVPPDAF